MTKKITSGMSKSQIKPVAKIIKCNNKKRANKDAANLIIETALNLVHGSNSKWKREPSWYKEDMDAMVALISDIEPRDSIEALLASQFVALHLNAMGVIQQDNYNIMGQGLMMVRLSHQALETLQRYRGKSQTINVNYNVLNQSGATLNALLQTGDLPKKGV